NYADGATHVCVLDPEFWELARRVMGDEIEAAPTAAAVASAQPAERSGWDRFLAGTRPVLAWAEGCRCTAIRNVDRVTVRAEFPIVIENQRTQPVSGTLSFSTLPEGWLPVIEKVTVGPIPPRGRGRYRLAVRVSRWPGTVTGHIDHQATLQIAGEQP